MVILRERGSVKYSHNLLFRASTYTYYTVRTFTFLHLQEIKTAERKINRQRMVRITRNTGDDYVCKKNPDLLLCIYTDLLMYDQFRIAADNWRKKDEMK